MLCSKILVAYDDSDLSQKSLEKATCLAKMNPSIKIQVVHVITIPEIDYLGSDNIQLLVNALYQKGKETMGKAELTLSALPNQAEFYLLEGKSTAYVILNHAQEHNCDLIIMGSRGLSGVKEFLGSVSHKIVQHSQIPVFIIK
ncbi:MAG: universal stress protein [Syntrophomonadaceae bacterium]|nr:universal stress protein [Syntrophomonadaceae bacterium]